MEAQLTLTEQRAMRKRREVPERDEACVRCGVVFRQRLFRSPILCLRCRGELDMHEAGNVVADPYETLMPADATPADWTMEPAAPEVQGSIGLAQMTKAAQYALAQNRLQGDCLKTALEEAKRLIGMLELASHHGAETRKAVTEIEMLLGQLEEVPNDGD